jgi:uncharacterized membrane protein YidH (DUF202 family)
LVQAALIAEARDGRRSLSDDTGTSRAVAGAALVGAAGLIAALAARRRYQRDWFHRGMDAFDKGDMKTAADKFGVGLHERKDGGGYIVSKGGF